VNSACFGLDISSFKNPCGINFKIAVSNE